MAILRSNDGRFYEVEDDQLEGKLIPADQVKERLGEVGAGPSSGPMGPGPEVIIPASSGQVVIQIYTTGGSEGACGLPEGSEEECGDVEAHGYGYGHGHRHGHGGWRRNHFRNYWRRNCWRNHCY